MAQYNPSEIVETKQSKSIDEAKNKMDTLCETEDKLNVAAGTVADEKLLSNESNTKLLLEHGTSISCMCLDTSEGLDYVTMSQDSLALKERKPNDSNDFLVYNLELEDDVDPNEFEELSEEAKQEIQQKRINIRKFINGLRKIRKIDTD